MAQLLKSEDDVEQVLEFVEMALGQSLNHLGTEFQALWLAKVLTSSLAQTNQELFPDRIKSQVTLTNDQISGIIDQ